MSLRALLRDAHFRRGARDFLVFCPAIGAWGVVAGVAMTQSGLGPWLAALMSLTVFAGSAQLASLPLLAVGAPFWVVCAAAACVNLRFLVFSAQWRVHIGHLPRGRRLLLGYALADMNLIAFQKAWPDGRRAPGQARWAAGSAVLSWLVWQASSFLGIALAASVPVAWGLGFAGTLAMLGIAYSLLEGRVAWVAAAVAATAAVAAFAWPLKLNIVLAIAAAVAVALVMGRAQGGAREATSS